MVFLGGPLVNVFFIVLLFFSPKVFKQLNLAWFLAFAFWVNVSQFARTACQLYPGAFHIDLDDQIIKEIDGRDFFAKNFITDE